MTFERVLNWWQGAMAIAAVIGALAAPNQASAQACSIPADCPDDGDPCTVADCIDTGGAPTPDTCQYNVQPPTTACDDGNACTTGETCGPTGNCAGGTPVDCDDSNTCTTDFCDTNDGCIYANNTNSCDDSDACTSGDTCSNGSCTGATVSCDDGNACTDDGTCVPATGCPAKVDNTDACTDGNPCTVGDACAAGSCVSGGTPLSCDDADACTDDICVDGVGCVNVNNNEPCDDGDACTSGDVCSAGSCAGATAVSCDDGNACTDDGTCVPASGCPVKVNNTDACDDGDPCTTGDVCAAGACTTGAGALSCDDANPCTDDLCVANVGCVNVNNNEACDDGDACTEGDTCAAGSCASGAAVSCDDGNACTDDGSCVPASGCPAKVDNTAACDDGNPCTTGDVCAAGACTSGAGTLDCDDANPCTDDVCVAGSGCVNLNNNEACDDGDACTAGDICAAGSCTSGTAVSCDDGNPCTDDGACVPASGCPAKVNNTDVCDDGNACTTGDVCAAGACTSGAAVDCDDSNVCTTNLCDVDTGCYSINNTNPCTDNNACTSGDVCSAGSCVSGSAVDCNDSNVCTTDTCDTVDGCEYANNALPCDDGSACTENDTCAGGSCGAGTAVDCDDGNVCTTDFCNASAGCLSVNNEASCDDSDACTRADRCAAGSCSGVALCENGNACAAGECTCTGDRFGARCEMSVTATIDPSTVDLGGTLSIEVTVTNESDLGSNNTRIQLSVPSPLTFAPSSGCTGTGQTATCSLGGVPAGLTMTRTINFSVPLGATAGAATATVGVVSGSEVTPDHTLSPAYTLVAAPDLAVSASTGGGEVTVGSLLIYSVSWSNDGADAGTGTALSVDVPTNTTFNSGIEAGWSCSNGAAAGTTCTFDLGAPVSGASGTVNFAVTVDEALAATDTSITAVFTINDDAGAVGHVAETVTTNNTATVVTPVSKEPDLVIEKTAVIEGGAPNIDPGAVVVYTLSYSNQGNQTAFAPVITETIPANTTFTPSGATNWSCPDGVQGGKSCTIVLPNLPPFSSGSVDFRITVDEALPSSVTTIPNTASIDADGNDLNFADNIDSFTLSVEEAADVAIVAVSHDVPGAGVSVGATIHYTVDYDNLGVAVAPDTVLTVPVPANTTFAPDPESAAGWTCGGGSCSLQLGTLAPNDPGSVVFAVTVDSSLTASVTAIATTFSIDFGGGGAVELSKTNNTKAVSIAVAAAPDVAVQTLTDGGVTTTLGQDITYTIGFENIGTAPATSVVLTEVIPVGTHLGAGNTLWTCNGTVAGSTCTRNLGTLAPNEPASAVFVVTVNDTLTAAETTIDNTASIAAASTGVPELSSTNNSRLVQTPVQPGPDIRVDVTADATVATVDQVVVYTITYRNQGTADATGVTVSAQVPNKTTYQGGDEVVGGTPGVNPWQCGGTSGGSVCVIDVGTLVAGAAPVSVSFTVKADSDLSGIAKFFNPVSITDDDLNGADLDATNDSVTHEILVGGAPDLSLTIDADTTEAASGDTVVYTLAYRNNGSEIAEGVTIRQVVPNHTVIIPEQTTADWENNCGQALVDLGNGLEEVQECVLTIGTVGAQSAITEVTFAVRVAPPLVASATEIVTQANIIDGAGEDLNEADNTRTLSIPLATGPHLILTATGNPEQAQVTKPVVYTLVWKNIGSADATGVKIAAKVPTNTTFNAGLSGFACGQPSCPTWVCANLGAAGADCQLSLPDTLVADGTEFTADFAVTVAETIPPALEELTFTASISDDGNNGGDLNLEADRAAVVNTLARGPDLHVESVTLDNPVGVGEVASFTFTASNTGTAQATSPQLEVTLPPFTSPSNAAALWNCSAPNVEPTVCTTKASVLTVMPEDGTQQQVTLNILVDSTLPAGALETTLTVSISDLDAAGDLAPADNQTSTTLNLTAGPDLEILTLAPDASTKVPGSTLTWSFDVANNGTRGATGIVVTATVPTATTYNADLNTVAWTCDAGSCTVDVGTLEVSESQALTFVVVVDDPVPAGLTQPSTTVSAADDGANGTDLATPSNTAVGNFLLSASASLNVSYTGPAATAPGAELAYVIDYWNTGNRNASGVKLVAKIPNLYASLVLPQDDDWVCSDGGQGNAGALCTLTIANEVVGGVAGAGEVGSGTATFRVQINETLPAGVSSLSSFVEISDDVDPGTVDDTATRVTPVTAGPDLVIQETPSVTTSTPGSSIRYSLDVSNEGTQAATGIVFTAVVPQNTRFMIANSSDGWVCDEATVNNLVPAGSTCTFSIDPQDLASLDVGQSLPIQAIFQVLLDNPIADGVTTIESSFSVNDDRPPEEDENPADNLSSTSIPVVADPVLEVTKGADANLKEPGDLVVYTLNYANTGNQHTKNVMLYEQVPANTVFETAAGEAWTCEVNDSGLYDTWCAVNSTCCRFEIGVLEVSSPGQTTFSVRVDKPLASGVTKLFNTASITDDGSNHDDGQPIAQPSNTVTTDLDATPGLQITFVNPPAQVAPGGVATYQVDYINEGVQNASNVELTLTLPDGVTLDPFRSVSGPFSCVPLQNPVSTRCTTNLGEIAVGAPGAGSISFVVEVAQDMTFTGDPEVIINAAMEDIGAVPPVAPDLAQAVTPFARCSVEHNAETSSGQFVAEPLDAENPGAGSLWEYVQDGLLPGGYWRTGGDGILAAEVAKPARLNLAIDVPLLTDGGLAPVVEVIFHLAGQSAPNQDQIVLCLSEPPAEGTDFSCSTASGAAEYQTGKNTIAGSPPGNAGPIDFNDGEFDHVFLDLTAWAGQQVILSVAYQPNGTDDAYQGLAILGVRQYSDADADGQLDGSEVTCDFCWDLDADGFANAQSPVFKDPHPFTPAQSCDTDPGDGIDQSVPDCDDTKGVLNADCSEDCADGVDNNLDGATDCADTLCAADPACFPCEKTFTFESGDMGWKVTPSGASAIKFQNRRSIGDPASSGWLLQDGSANKSFSAFLYRTVTVPPASEMPEPELVVTYTKTAVGLVGACLVSPTGDLTTVENCPNSALFKISEDTPGGEAVTRTQAIPPEWIGQDVRVVLFYDGQESAGVDADVFLSHVSIRSDVDGDGLPEGSTPTHPQCDPCVDHDGDNYANTGFLDFSSCGADCNDEDPLSNPDATDLYECSTEGDQNCDGVSDDDDQACRVCGDGKVTAGEQCDDGILGGVVGTPVDGDGCSADCQLEINENTGRFYVTEIHLSQFNNAAQQWFELRNDSGADIDPLALNLEFLNSAGQVKALSDCMFPDGAGGFTATPDKVIIPRGSYFVVSLGTPVTSLIKSADAFCSGNVVLSENGDRLALRAGTVVLDNVDFRNFTCEVGNALVEGNGFQRSFELAQPQGASTGANNDAGAWCLARSPVLVGGNLSPTDYGSPGTGGDCGELFCDGVDDDCDGSTDEIEAGGLTDADGDLVCDDPDVDCDNTEPLCALDCVTNQDLDGRPDCRDGCIDRDGDGYGAPGNNPARDLVCTGCVNPRADCEFCNDPANDADPFCAPCQDPKSLLERCLPVCTDLPTLSCPGVDCAPLYLDCEFCKANPDDPTCPNCTENPDDYRCQADCSTVAGQDCQTTQCTNPRAHCNYCANEGKGTAACAICQVDPDSTQKCVADCSLLPLSNCGSYACTSPRTECEDCQANPLLCPECTDGDTTNDTERCAAECGLLPERRCPSLDCNDTQANGGDVNIGGLEGDLGAVAGSCTDGLDNDCDGLTDCSDGACKGSIECQGATCDKPLFIECGVPMFVQPASADLPCAAGPDSVVQFHANAKEFQDQGTGTVTVRVQNEGPNALAGFVFENSCSGADICAPDESVSGLCGQERQQVVNVTYDSLYNIVLDEVTPECPAQGTGVPGAWLTVICSEDCERPGDEDADGAENCNDPECLQTTVCLEEDFDNDGVSNKNEAICSTSPTDPFVAPTPLQLADSDGDGILNCADPDQDGDGLPNEIELLLNTDPLEPDTDNDGLLDGEEDVNKNGVVDANETSPTDPDSDQDNLTDGQEVTSCYDVDTTTSKCLSTNPLDPDTDDDGLPDGDEDQADKGTIGLLDPGETSPLRADSDGDGYNDGDEILCGSDPLDGKDAPQFIIDQNAGLAPEDQECDGVKIDSDADGVPDGVEAFCGTDPTNANKFPDFASLTDTDGDQLIDCLDLDDDNDGVPDTLEVVCGTDPKSELETPTLEEVLDTDGDTLRNCVDDDDDNDGLKDFEECLVVALSTLPEGHTGPPCAPGVGYETDPYDADTDDDGVRDGDEAFFNMNPLSADTDNDGILDGTEHGVTTELLDQVKWGRDTNRDIFVPDSDPFTRTDPLNPDTDDDGLLDGEEDVNHNGRVDLCERDPETNLKLDSGCLDEFDPNDGDDVKADSDGDGLNDKEEREVYNTDPDSPDTDKDGLLDGQEVKVHLTDPNVVDTDNGGVGDGDEVENGTNPLKPEDDFSIGKLSGNNQQSCAATGADEDGGTTPILVVLAVFGLLLAFRRRSVALALAVILAGSLGATPSAHAQTTSPGTGLSAMGYRNQGGHYRIWSVEESRVSPHLIPYGSAMFFVETESLRLVTGLANETLVEYAAYADFNLGIGLYDWVQVELDLPVVLGSGSGDNVRSITPVSGAGIGDLVFRARTRLLDNTAGGFGIGFAAGMTFPTGDGSKFRGDPGFGILLNTVWDFRTSRVVTALNIGFHLRTEAIKFFDSTIEHEMTYGLGVDVTVWRNHVTIGGEMSGRTNLVQPFADKEATSLELMVGPKISIIEGLSFQAAIGGGIIRAAGTPEIRALAGFAWAPRVQDSDQDDIVEADDECPLDQEDKDNYRDGDGCPDPDNDGDGVPDLVDKCPMAPEDRNGIDDTDGCPDEDQDGDKIIDLVDRCPYEPEDHDGFQDRDGCPESDNDNDGIPDIYDECPNRAETYNRYKNEDGCPDVPACLARLTNLIFFEEGKAELDREDQEELKLIADQIVDNELIDRVVILGHAFLEGGVTSTHNTVNRPGRDVAVLTELGRRRAEAVRDFLIHWQVPAELLAMESVADSSPLTRDRPGVEGKPTRNRRVSFRLEMDSRCNVFQGGRVDPPR